MCVEYNPQYGEQHKEELRLEAKHYKEESRETICETGKKYREQNRDARLEKKKQYRETTKKKPNRRRMNEYYENSKEEIQEK